jgi:hypothetical protein
MRVLPSESFHKDTNALDGLQGTCKPCRKALRNATKIRKQFLYSASELLCRPIEHTLEQMLEEHQAPLLGRLWGVCRTDAIEIARNPWLTRLDEKDAFMGEYMLNRAKKRQLIDYLEEEASRQREQLAS